MDVKTELEPQTLLPPLPWTATTARIVLTELKKSGLSPTQFSVRHKIATYRLNYWRYKLDAPSKKPKLLSVNVTSTKPLADVPVGHGTIEVSALNSVTIRIQGRVVPETLSQTLKLCGVVPC
jgi:hypothetical protein